MAGQGAAKRANAKRTKAKRQRKRAAQHAANAHNELSVPSVTEDDLLAFQISHFGDDTKPVIWFVPADTALHYDPTREDDLEEEDDGLGYYEDGVKRTLTDEQIEMFRHSEMEMMLREERLRREASETPPGETGTIEQAPDNTTLPVSAVSPASSIEGDLLGLAGSERAAPFTPSAARAPSQSSRSETSSFSSDPKRRRRKKDIPYQERHKRKWENYIEGNDPVEGSLTHRRIVREMDELQDASVELDY